MKADAAFSVLFRYILSGGRKTIRVGLKEPMQHREVLPLRESGMVTQQ